MKPNFIAIMVLLLAAASHAAEPVEYTKQVLPVLEKHCVECHGPKKQESSLRVDSRAALIKGIWISKDDRKTWKRHGAVKQVINSPDKSTLVIADGAAVGVFNAPVVIANPGAEFQDEARPGAMIIGMDRTPKGRIWGCWTGTGDKKDGYFLLAMSDDDGATWSKPRLAVGARTEPDQKLSGALVGNLWSDPKGRLWMLARTKGQPHESFSSDGGRTWSEPRQAATVQNVNARFFLRRLKSGRILLVKNGPPTERLQKRTHMSAWLSEDDGQTWKGGLLLDERIAVSYPDGFESPAGLIHILYDWNRHTDAEILMARFREEDVLAGKIVSHDGKLRMLANKARLPVTIRPNAHWAAQATEDAKQDRTTVPYDGVSPNKMVCDTTLRLMPDHSWIISMLAGDDFEPSPKNYIGITRSTDQGRTWSPLSPVETTFPRNGVLVSRDGGKTFSEHGNIRITDDDRYHGWAENSLVELADGRIAMVIRADRLGGVLYYAESKDGGRTWPDFATKTTIPNPGSKATLYGLGGDTVALLHNPNAKHRSPMALWISFDGMKTWPYQRVLQAESCDSPKGRMNYPDGFVSADKQWLHFAFDDNRHRCVHYSAKLPPR